MPRTLRASAADYCYHVLNRGNRRARVFHSDGDYEAFLATLAEASVRIPMRVLAFCLMPNHFHLVLRPIGDGDLSRWMHWLTTAHVRRYLRHYRSSGHVWQGRFKAFPIEDDDHLRTVLRYVERNPLRANLVERAEDWPWSSLPPPAKGTIAPTLDPGPESARRGEGWVERVNAAMSEAELERLRRSVTRGAPFGSASWTTATASRLGLESSLNPPGRPRAAGRHETCSAIKGSRTPSNREPTSSGGTTMPKGDKSKYTDKQKRQAEHIEEGYEKRGVPAGEAKGRAWATVNKETGGGNKSGSGRGKADTNISSKKGGKKGGAASSSRTAAERSASAKKGAATRKRNAAKARKSS